MSITNYTELQASVAAWLHRTDLTSVIPDFIALAEADMNSDITARAMELTATLTCSSASRYVALPTDMVEMKRILMADSNPATVLEYKSPDQLLQDNPFIQSTGRPLCFTIVGASIELSPPPDFNYPLELLYLQRIPPLASNATNWLLSASPNVYLFGSLVKAAVYTQDEARLQVWKSQYDEAVANVNGIDWYSGSTMRVKVR